MSTDNTPTKGLSAIISTEINDAFSIWRFALFRSFLHVKLAHRNTSLGLLWEPLFLLIVSFFIALVWSKIFGVKDFYVFFQYVLSGFAIWGFISSVVRRGINIIRGYASTIINSRDPILAYIFSDIFFEVISYLLKLPLVLIVILLLGDLSLKGILIHLYGLALITFSGIGFALLFGTLAAFFGDVRELVSAMMRLAFLVTPIIWTVDRLGAYQSYLYMNPFYSYLEVCRKPLLENTVGLAEIVIATSLTIILLVSGIIVQGKYVEALKQKVFEL